MATPIVVAAIKNLAIMVSDGDGDWFGVFWESLSQKKTRAIAMATPIVVAAIKNPVIMVGDSDGDDDVD